VGGHDHVIGAEVGNGGGVETAEESRLRRRIDDDELVARCGAAHPGGHFSAAAAFVPADGDRIAAGGQVEIGVAAVTEEHSRVIVVAGGGTLIVVVVD